jgi:tetratricopeptide (TPR) repeat protein
MCTDDMTNVPGRPRSRTGALAARWLTLALLVTLAACAPRTVPPPAIPVVAAHPDFLFPAVPEALQGTPEAQRHEFGWRYLQSNETRAASREFAAVLQARPDFYPAHAGEGWAALARREAAAAVRAFDAALGMSAAYVPALVGRGRALLVLERDEEALLAFEAALAADPSMTDLQAPVEALRLRRMQDLTDTARRAADDGRFPEARAAYLRALEASPESAFLHRELGLVERRAGDEEAALERFGRASELDRFDDAALVQIGEILEGREDYVGAEAAYRRAAAIEPGPSIDARITRVMERARDARLPAQFGPIASAPQITRGDLAAIIGLRLEPVLRSAPQQAVVLADAQDHWASDWIAATARTGILPAFQNHRFEPESPVRRMDLADAVRNLVTVIADRNPGLRTRLAERPQIADVGPAHLSYPAVAAAVATGAMDLTDGRRFEVTRAVSGAEAFETIDRLRALAGLR